MLVLTRKEGQQIVIGEDVRVTVLEIRGGSIRLGFEAPTNVQIVREELHDRLTGERLGRRPAVLTG